MKRVTISSTQPTMQEIGFDFVEFSAGFINFFIYLLVLSS